MKCNECDFETDNGKIMSNHKRWKHKNISFSEEGLLQIKETSSKRFGKKERNFVCQKCGKEFVKIMTENTFLETKKFFCSRSCANSRDWNEEKRKRHSKIFLKEDSIINRKCEFCEKTYNTKYKNSKFCSRKCKGIASQINSDDLVSYRKSHTDFLIPKTYLLFVVFFLFLF